MVIATLVLYYYLLDPWPWLEAGGQSEYSGYSRISDFCPMTLSSSVVFTWVKCVFVPKCFSY